MIILDEHHVATLKMFRSTWLQNRMEKQQKDVVVIGAGVVGLSTAIKVQEHGGYKVTIVAETLPSDPKSTRYTSHWAAAHHVSYATNDKKQEEMEQETFDVMWKLSAPGGGAEGCIMRSPHIVAFFKESDGAGLIYSESRPDFQYLPANHPALPPGCAGGAQFTTVTIEPPRYLNYLLAQFLARGGLIVRGNVQHIHQVIEGGARIFSGPRTEKGSPPDAVIVCAGIGARFLGGVEDKDVYPVRGQTVLLRAPWVKTGIFVLAAEGPQGDTYVVPRRSGDVILGGTRIPDDWYPSARPETTLDILRRSLLYCPELAPPEIRAVREPTIQDLQDIIVESGCGFRPARKGGVRLELEWVQLGESKKVPVVYNYGHGGFGFQSSLGSASMALKLLEGAFAT